MGEPKVPKPGWMVYVEMDDMEHSHDGWDSATNIRAARPRTFKALGWVVRASKRSLVIANVTAPDAAFCHYVIPWGAVRRLDRVKG